MTETEKKAAYDKKPVILPEDELFGQMMVSAVRYALGRMTYIVRTTTDYVTPLIPWLPYNALRIIAEDIRKYDDFYDLGMECDRKRWIDLANAIRAEMKERTEKFKNGRD